MYACLTSMPILAWGIVHARASAHAQTWMNVGTKAGERCEEELVLYTLIDLLCHE